MSLHYLSFNPAQNWLTSQLSNKTTYAIMAGLAAIVATLLSQWQMSDESWGYWFFARILGETGEFIIPDRSPIYTLYLNAFRWLGYPASVNAEYFVTSVIVVTALVALLKRYMGIGWAAFAVILWIPFMQVAEPPVQKLALACACWALVTRLSGRSRFSVVSSYAMLVLACMFRVTYSTMILVFLAWDIAHLIRRTDLRGVFRTARPGLFAWPLGLVVVLFLVFAGLQSPHRWNNGWYSSTTWSPVSGKSLAEASFFQEYNNNYVRDTYGNFVGHDIYFTNQELFEGADSILGAIVANPAFVLKNLIENAKNSYDTMHELTEFPRVTWWVPRRVGSGSLPFFAGISVGLLLGLYGAMRASGEPYTKVFVLGSVLLGVVATVSAPKLRYMVPLIPVFILAGYWYGSRISRLLPGVDGWLVNRMVWIAVSGTGLITLWFGLRLLMAPIGPWTLSAVAIGYGVVASLLIVGMLNRHGKGQRLSSVASFAAIPVALILLSNGATTWTSVVGSLIGGEPQRAVRVEVRDSFEALNSIVRDCRGVLSMEHSFVAAFMDIPESRVYDIWEIPPFGHLDQSDYTGLNPNRIDCVLESTRFERTGNTVNIKIRYDNYILPYIERLQAMGATTYPIPNYGRVIILSNANL